MRGWNLCAFLVVVVYCKPFFGTCFNFWLDDDDDCADDDDDCD